MKTNIPYHPRHWSALQWLTFIILMILLMLLAVVTAGHAQKFDRSAIDKEAEKYVKDLYNHGLVVGIITPEGQQVFTYGETKKGNGIKPDSNSVFDLGSISEVFTTSLMAVMEKEGKLSSLESVKDVLRNKVDIPSYVRKICIKDDNFDPSSVDPSRRRGQICYPDPNSIPQDMILCDLASHSSGLPEEPGLSIFKNNKNPYANFTTEKLNKYVSNLQAIAPFGYEYNHSAIGMALLGEALSVRGNNAFDVLLKEKVLDPLGMRYTFVEPNTTQKRLLMYGHDNKGAGLPHVDYNAMSPAFGVHSNVADLLRFLNANLKQGNTPLSYALHETQSPRIYTNPFNMNYLVGWGWVIVPLEPKNAKNNKKVWWQCGEKSGFASFIGFVKETGVGVVVLSNSTESVDDMSFKILKSLDEYVEKSKTALK